VPRGLIVNISADAMFCCVPFPAPLDQATAEQMVQGYHALVERYVGTQVSHLFLNVNFQRAAFDSEVWAAYWDVSDPAKQTSGWPRMSWLVHRAGVDPFAVCIAACRKRGLSPWLSMRMNDTHYIGDAAKANPFWKGRPELRRAPNSGFDFARAEVREHHLALVRELLERYDADGIELDWMRFAWHFKPGQEEAGRPLLTEFVRQVRMLTDQTARRRGHPVGIAARVPGRPDFARGLGMDGGAWVKEGLVDVLIPCSTWRPTDTDMPIEQWRRLIGETGVRFTIAAGADLWIQCRPGGVLMRDNLASARGFTAAMLHRGADAIYLFNHFNTSDFRHQFKQPDGTTVLRDEYRTLMSEVGKLDTVLGKPRRHVLTFADTAPPGVPNPRPLPAELKEGQPFTVRLYTGPRPKGGNVILKVGLDERPGLWVARLAATVNGTACRPMADLNQPGDFQRPRGRGSHVVWRVAEVAPRVAQLACPHTVMQDGSQGIEIGLAEGEPQRVVWFEAAIAPQGLTAGR
jgi:hypothetical protein